MTEELAQHNTAIRAGRLSKRPVTTGLTGSGRGRRRAKVLYCTARGSSETYRHAFDTMAACVQVERAVVFLCLRGLREGMAGHLTTQRVDQGPS
jgi:hypothetical protein